MLDNTPKNSYSDSCEQSPIQAPKKHETSCGEITAPTLWQKVKIQWHKRKPFPGWGILLFYCHMLMFSTAGAALRFGETPELKLFLAASGVLVPIAFGFTTACLFIRKTFYIPLMLGVLQAIIGFGILIKVCLLPANPDSTPPLLTFGWYAGVLVGLLGLIALAVLRYRGTVRLPWEKKKPSHQ